MKLFVLSLAMCLVGSAPAACQDPNSTIPELSLVGLSFVAVRVSDIDAASSWYQSVFGVSEGSRITGDDGRYFIRVLSGGGLSVELIEERGVERPAERHLGLFKAGIYVADIDAFHLRLEALGVDQDATAFFDEALNARSFVFRDSEGNRLQAFQSCADNC